MKKTINNILLTIMIILSLGFTTAYAQNCTGQGKPGEICYNGEWRNLLQLLTDRPGEWTKEGPATRVAELPNISLESGAATVIKTLLGWSMLFTTIAIVVAAIYYLISQGKEEDVSKAKSIILYLIIGMAIMAGAYGIVSGVTRFSFFD